MRRLTLVWLTLCLLASPSAQAQTLIGNLFRIDVDDTTPGIDLVTQADGSGRTLAVWAGDDGDDRGLFVRRFGTDGQPDGPPIRLNDETAGNDISPALLVADDGSFIVVWSHGAAGSTAIRLRRFDAGLTPNGPVIELANAMGESLDNPAIVPLPDGGLYAVWQRESPVPITNPDSEIEGRLLAANGQPRNRVIQISNAAGNSAREPRLAVGADGGVLFVWKSSAPGFGLDYLMRYRNPQGLLEEFSRRLNPDEHTVVDSVRIAATRDGYLALWTAKQTGVGAPTERLAFHRRLDLATRFASPATPFPSVPSADQVEVAVSPAADGRLVTSRALHISNLPGSAFPSSEVRALFFSSEGEPIGEELLVAREEVGRQSQLTASATTGGRFFLGWSEPSDRTGTGSSFDLAARIVQAPGGCFGNDETLCLNGDRFQVRANWRRPDGLQGAATARTLTDETGFFYFQEAGNIEMVVKVLDACSFADHFWVFAAGLTNLEVELEVVDTLFAETRTYRNPLAQPFTPVQDTTAFDTCSTE